MFARTPGQVNVIRSKHKREVFRVDATNSFKGREGIVAHILNLSTELW